MRISDPERVAVYTIPSHRSFADANRKWGKQTGLGHAETIENWLTLTPIERAAGLPALLKIVSRIYPGQTKAEPHYESHAGRLLCGALCFALWPPR